MMKNPIKTHASFILRRKSNKSFTSIRKSNKTWITKILAWATIFGHAGPGFPAADSKHLFCVIASSTVWLLLL